MQQKCPADLEDTIIWLIRVSDTIKRINDELNSQEFRRQQEEVHKSAEKVVAFQKKIIDKETDPVYKEELIKHREKWKKVHQIDEPDKFKVMLLFVVISSVIMSTVVVIVVVTVINQR